MLSYKTSTEQSSWELKFFWRLLFYMPSNIAREPWVSKVTHYPLSGRGGGIFVAIREQLQLIFKYKFNPKFLLKILISPLKMILNIQFKFPRH